MKSDNKGINKTTNTKGSGLTIIGQRVRVRVRALSNFRLL
jgi:hypothetical protein